MNEFILQALPYGLVCQQIIRGLIFIGGIDHCAGDEFAEMREILLLFILGGHHTEANLLRSIKIIRPECQCNQVGIALKEGSARLVDKVVTLGAANKKDAGDAPGI